MLVFPQLKQKEAREQHSASRLGAIYMPGQRTFSPGENVPESGIYRVTHRRHRVPHEITVLAGQKFPVCRRCGLQVSFELIRSAERPEEDRDLAAGAAAE